MNPTEHRYTPPDQGLWRGRADCPYQSRFWQQVQCIDLNEEKLPDGKDICIAGFACDAGIKRNGGRIGAASGSDALRLKLSPRVIHQNKKKIYDLGNIVCPDDEMELSQKQLGDLVQLCHQKGHTSIVLGGGHEVAYAHFLGLYEHYQDIGFINFDAHFDLRPFDEIHRTNSGTPFRQIAHLCKTINQPFSYCCIGIQKEANSLSLFKTAQELDVSWLSADDINQESIAWQKAFLDEFLLKNKYIYLSICLDVFAQVYAPGVSAPQPLGLTPWQALNLLKYVLQSGKVVAIDMAELSPPLDVGEKTAGLAASILTHLIDIL